MEIIAGLPQKKRMISCVIQLNPDGTSVSQSGFEHVFEGIADQREEENEELIVLKMDETGFKLNGRMTYDLPNGKQFVRLDFAAA
jgi:hypothetical protein